MCPIDKRLFDLYCAPILQNAENFDQSALEKVIAPFSLTGEQRVKLMDAFFDNYTQ